MRRLDAWPFGYAKQADSMAIRNRRHGDQKGTEAMSEALGMRQGIAPKPYGGSGGAWGDQFLGYAKHTGNMAMRRRGHNGHEATEAMRKHRGMAHGPHGDHGGDTER